MTGRILFDWSEESKTLTTDLLVDAIVFENAVQVFEVRDVTPKQTFFDRIGDLEELGMRLLSTIKEAGKAGLLFCFASAVKVEDLDRKWRDLGTVADTKAVYRYYLDRLVPREFANIRKTLDKIWEEVSKTMSDIPVVNLHFHVQIDRKRASELLKLAKTESWKITSEQTNGTILDITLSSRINRQYLQALGELSTVFVNTKQMDAKLVGFGIERSN